jgi:hypothetical protein
MRAPRMATRIELRLEIAPSLIGDSLDGAVVGECLQCRRL